ncbi:MAG: hemolysin III family protein [Bacilli bacterium]
MTVAEIKENIEQQKLPTYSKGEERFHYISHAVGIALGFICLGSFIALAILFNYNIWETFSLIFFSVSMITLYATSTIYHAISPKSIWKKLFRLLDHNIIYLLIAGSYAPICAFAFKGTNYGLIIMSVQIFGLLAGTIMNMISLSGKVTSVVTVILYVVMGWFLFIFYPAMSLIPLTIMLFLLFGGISYTVGVIFYAVGHKIKWMHGIFHLFVLVGTILQLVGILLLII